MAVSEAQVCGEVGCVGGGQAKTGVLPAFAIEPYRYALIGDHVLAVVQ